jgi:hypothetical protein
MDHSRYVVSDPSDPRFRVTALIEEEQLVIDLRTQLESGERSAVLNAADQLRRILARFFPRYRSVRISWRFGENLVAFNRCTAAGATPEEASRRTAVGHQLALAGYSRPQILSLEGFTARYTKVVVSFHKEGLHARELAPRVEKPGKEARTEDTEVTEGLLES